MCSRRLRWGRGAAIAGVALLVTAIAVAWHMMATPRAADDRDVANALVAMGIAIAVQQPMTATQNNAWTVLGE